LPAVFKRQREKRATSSDSNAEKWSIIMQFAVGRVRHDMLQTNSQKVES
jgi:hypothetical protein